ncbi:MAG: UDP-N-acetylmuramate--L-alanine ligase [Gemmatimonadaceae bacterium]|nr:UDP-N-acetylmuramate--L-alanine ligase [Gemmatimonadaceae bacterium]
MTLLDTADNRPVHFVGVAGAGMSALAELFVRRGVQVTGCDAYPTGVEDLRRLGVTIDIGHDPAHLAGARAVVVTSAVPPNHPELRAARELGIPVVKRAQALGDVTAGRDCVAVAGTHGKTTTTVLTAEALAAAGRDPTAVVGGRVSVWGGNLRPGSDQLYVVEADEYDRSFLTLFPTVAIVTNVEADHLDIYADLEDIRRTFGEFLGHARHIVLCADDAGANSLPMPSGAEIIRYGTRSPDARLVATDIEQRDGGQRMQVVHDGEPLGPLTLRVPGRHNLHNALAAVGAGLAMGLTLDAMRAGLEGFGGVTRRFERVGEAGGVLVIDDYAHHPTEVVATIEAARAAFPERRLVTAFQPHLYSRTRDFQAEFGAALVPADAVFLCEIYGSREQPIDGVDSGLVAAAMERAGQGPAWRGERTELAAAIAAAAAPGDIVVLMGAGDITRTGPELLSLLGGA